MRITPARTITWLAVGLLACGQPAPVLAPAPVVTVAERSAAPPPPETFIASSDAVGYPDPTFGEGGVSLTSIGPGEHRLAAVVAMPDGALAAVGYAPFDGHHDIAAVRYRADGTLDPSFGDGGVTRVGSGRGFGRAIAGDASGRLLVAGYYYSKTAEDLLLARLDARGRLDRTFGAGGIVRRDFGNSDDRPAAVLVRGDGRILVVANHDAATGAVICFEPSGAACPGFGRAGMVAFEMTAATHRAFPTRARLQRDSKIVIGGYLPQLNTGVVVRLLADGTRDVSFGVGGLVEIGGPAIGASWALAIDGRGRILFSGDSEVGPALVARLLPDGQPDPSWGDEGIAMTWVEGRSQLYALLVDANDRVTGVGFHGLAEDAEAFLVRFTADGVPDDRFGSNGVVTSDFGPGTFVFDGTWDASGHLVVAGEVLGGPSRWLLARYR